MAGLRVRIKRSNRIAALCSLMAGGSGFPLAISAKTRSQPCSSDYNSCPVGWCLFVLAFFMDTREAHRDDPINLLASN